MSNLSIEFAVDDLLEAASRVNQVVPTRGPKPALSNILFHVVDGVLELRGTDLQLSITYQVPSATVRDAGSLLLNGAYTVDLLKQFKGLQGEIVADARGNCRFVAPGGNYKLYGSDPRDFPEIPRPFDEPGCPVAAPTLAEMLRQTEFAVSADQTRGMITHGIAVELTADYLRLTSTDTKRLSVAQHDMAVEEALTFSAVLPSNCAKLLLKILSAYKPAGADEDDPCAKDVLLGHKAPNIFVRGDKFLITATELNGTYPPYYDALGLTLAEHVDFTNADLRQLLGRAMLVDDSTAVFRFAPGSLTLFSRSRETGQSKVELPIVYSGPEVAIGFNPGYVDDALAVMKVSKVRFAFESRFKAGLLTELVVDGEGVEKESRAFRYFLMPLADNPESIMGGN